MPAEAVTEPHPMPLVISDQDWRNFCCDFVFRLLKATTEYGMDMGDEFLFDKASVEDWLTMLQQLAYPLHQYLEDGSSAFHATQSHEWGTNRKYCKYYDHKLSSAIACLQDTQDPVKAIFAALRHVLDARDAAQLWGKKLLDDGAVRVRYSWFDFLKFSELGQKFTGLITQLDEAVKAKDDLDICRQSRLAYLYRAYLYLVTSDETAESRDKDLIKLHQEALTVMKNGPAKNHTDLRLKKMMRQTP